MSAMRRKRTLVALKRHAPQDAGRVTRGRRMRPKTVIAFETLYLITLGMGLIHSVATWNEAVALASPGFILFVGASTLVLMLVLTLLVSRRRSNVAKWIMIGLMGLGLPFVVGQLGSGMVLGWPLMTLAQTLIQIAALGLLFSPSARAWLSQRTMEPVHAEP